LSGERWDTLGAASGALFVLLFAIGGSQMGTPADFGGPPAAAAEYFDDKQSQIQVGAAVVAAGAPFLVWFLATVQSLARAVGDRPRRAAMVAYGCGLAALTLTLADIAALAVGALRPGNMADAPELAAALLDFSFLAIAMAAFLTAGVAAACALLALRDRVIWPAWLGWLAVAAAVACSLRVGTLFTTTGVFTAGGALGFWTPVVGLLGWLALASLQLALAGGRRPACDGAGA
jgi:hypothetical protein